MKKILALLLVMAMICTLFATISFADNEKTVVTFQTWNPADSGEGSPIYQIIDAFEAENPDIEINYLFQEIVQ